MASENHETLITLFGFHGENTPLHTGNDNQHTTWESNIYLKAVRFNKSIIFK